MISSSCAVVDKTLELDDDVLAEAAEVHDESVQHVLSPELQSENPPVPHQRPHVLLGGCGLTAHLTSQLEELSRSQMTQGIHSRKCDGEDCFQLPKTRDTPQNELTHRSPSPEGRGGQGVRTNREGTGGEDKPRGGRGGGKTGR